MKSDPRPALARLHALAKLIQRHGCDDGYAVLSTEVSSALGAASARTEVREARRRYADRTDRTTP